MKKVLFLFASIIFLSCSKSDDNNTITQQVNIVNKWRITAYFQNGIQVNEEVCNINFDVTEFTADGNSITKYGNPNSSGICTQYTENGKYTVTNNILEDVQRNSNNVIIYKTQSKITELTTTTLKLSLLYVYETNSDGTNPNATNFTEGQEVRVYSKI